MTIDYVTGLMAAIVEKNVSSQIGFRGMFKKTFIILLVAMVQIIDQHLLQDGSVVRTAIIFYYLSNEGISILENSARIGLPVPARLRLVLKQLNQEEDDDISR